MACPISILKWFRDAFLDIGLSVTTLIGLLGVGIEFVVLTVVFISLIFFRGRASDKLIEKTSGSWFFICLLVAFALFYAILMISKGVLDFTCFHWSEKLLGALIGWIILLGFLVGAVITIRDYRNRSKGKNSAGRDAQE